MAYLNSRLSFRLILGRESSSRRVKRLGCGGENKEEKLQRIKISLDLFVLLHQGKRTKNNILKLPLGKFNSPSTKPFSPQYTHTHNYTHT